MSKDLPDFLTRGERARLIPVTADSSKEARAASILLATMSCVAPFAKVLLGGLGQRLGARTGVAAYTEIEFHRSLEGLRSRPDGLLVLESGNRSWRALVEAKIGPARLDKEQLTLYCELARLNGIDAVITVSNEFVALPTHHPVKLLRTVTKALELYHWSWMHVLTQATLLLHEHDFGAPEQRYLLREMVRYYEHDSVGVSSFDRMNIEWKDLVTKVQSGAPLNKSAPEVQNSVAAWHQEQRDLCLLMSRKLGRHVGLKLSRSHANDQVRWLRDDCEDLTQTRSLTCVLEVPDAAAPISVTADIALRTVHCAMRLAAPKDKKQFKSRTNWLVLQLNHVNSDDVFIRAIWPGRAQDTQAKLEDVRYDKNVLLGDKASLLPQYFEVILVRDLAGKFSGTRNFVEHLESAVPNYYEQVGQHLRAWVSPPPKIIENEEERADTGQKSPSHSPNIGEPQMSNAEDTDSAEPSTLEHS